MKKLIFLSVVFFLRTGLLQAQSGPYVVPTNTNGLTAAQAATLASAVTTNMLTRTFYVATNGNDLTAVINDASHPWKTVYDFTNGTLLGVMAQATKFGDKVIFLSDNFSPVLPFQSPGVTVDLGGHTLIRTNVTASFTNFPIVRSDFNLPFVFINDNCTLKNGTLYHNIDQPYSVGTTYDFGMQPSILKYGGFNIGTNIAQLVAFTPGASNEDFGIWPEYGITNNGATNFIVDSVFLNQLSYDVSFVDDWQLEGSDTNGNGDYFYQFLKPTKIIFKGGSTFSYWDAHIFKGQGVTAEFDSHSIKRSLNYNGYVNYTAAWTHGDGSLMYVNGGTLNDASGSTTNILVATVVGGRGASGGNGNAPSSGVASWGALYLNGLSMVASMTNYLDTSYPPGTTNADVTAFGWYYGTNGAVRYLNTGSNSITAQNISSTFTGNGAGLTNLNLGSLTGTTPSLITSFTNSLYITNKGSVYRVPVY